MSMSKSSNTYNRTNWEDSEFPILCQTCLGVNPYMRMIKEKFGSECKICSRPFTTFRWCPGKNMRYKKTEVCQTCSKLKNVCQTCLLDLEYGLPVAVRDYALGLKDDTPKSGANRDYYMQNADRELAKTDGTTPGGALGKMIDQGPNDLLKKLARTQPYYERNKPHICSFWVKGECKRGEECPFRHEKPTDPDDPLSDQNIKDRYFGTKDPVAEKLLNRAKALPVLKPPEDKTITTLYIGSLGDDNEITEKDIRNYFYQFGEIRNISLLSGKGCGFVQFTTRDSAELAAEKTFNKLLIKGRRIMVRWGRPHSQQNTLTNEGRATKQFEQVPGLPHALPAVDFFNLASDAPESKRPRMDAGGSSASYAASSFPSSSAVNVNPFVPRMPTQFVRGMRPPQQLVVPRIPYISPIPSEGQSSASRPNVRQDTDSGPSTSQASGSGQRGIYYPSQDPQHLGAKDLAD